MASRPDGAKKDRPYPIDWHERTLWRGFARNELNRQYIVRVSAQGKQHFVAMADCQEQAAMLYDLALWKLAPKLTRKLKLNFPDDFSFITQEKVDRICPRLNELFNELTWVRAEDETKDQDELRRAILTDSRSGVRATCLAVEKFDAQLVRLKRLRAHLDTEATEFDVAHLGIGGFLKLAEAPTLWKGCGEGAQTMANNLKLLIESMERQRPYLVKLNSINSGELL